MKTKLGIFGGTFNPIHIGHLIIAEAAREQYALQKVLFIPSAHPPHKQEHDIIPAHHRYQLVSLAVAGNPFFDVSDIEMKREGRSYSVETLKFLRQTETHPADYFFIVGADSVPELRTWKNVEELARLCTFLVVPRPDWQLDRLASEDLGLPPWIVEQLLTHVVSAPLIGISSTDIRHRVANGLSIKYLVPHPVEEYIVQHALYRKADTST
jgi:nicotinate-nucleotide adenylyltransferase